MKHTENKKPKPAQKQITYQNQPKSKTQNTKNPHIPSEKHPKKSKTPCSQFELVFWISR